MEVKAVEWRVVVVQVVTARAVELEAVVMVVVARVGATRAVVSEAVIMVGEKAAPLAAQEKEMVAQVVRVVEEMVMARQGVGLMVKGSPEVPAVVAARAVVAMDVAEEAMGMVVAGRGAVAAARELAAVAKAMVVECTVTEGVTVAKKERSLAPLARPSRSSTRGRSAQAPPTGHPTAPSATTPPSRQTTRSPAATPSMASPGSR